jgi:hypothetical protein
MVLFPPRTASLRRPVQVRGGTVGKDHCQHRGQDHRDDLQVLGMPGAKN